VGSPIVNEGVGAINLIGPAGVLATACYAKGDQIEAGPSGVSGRLIVPRKPGNTGGTCDGDSLDKCPPFGNDLSGKPLALSFSGQSMAFALLGR
jgi:hypothetical protein